MSAGSRGRSPQPDLRELPSVEQLAAQLGTCPTGAAVAAARAADRAARKRLLAGGAAGDLPPRSAEAALRPSLRRVLNATGVIVHTNLGRAPLAREAAEAAAATAAGYTNLEYDLEAGARGSRQEHVEALLRELTGAEAALAVNNCAAAVLLAAAALAGGRELVVSRGQLVEIGGSFRIPEVIAQSGARLVEVGTTNRTRLADYERALGPETGGDPARPPVELPHGGLHRGGLGRGPLPARAARDRRRRLRRARRGPSRAGRRAAGAAVGRGGRRGGLLLGRQAPRRPAGGPDGGNPGCRRPLPLASARARRADRQAVAGRARGDASALPRPRGRPGIDTRAADARRRRGGAPGTGRADARPPGRRRPRRSARRPRWAGARCRCWSWRGRCARSTRASSASTSWRAGSARRRRPWWPAPARAGCLLDPRTLDDDEAREAAAPSAALRGLGRPAAALLMEAAPLTLGTAGHIDHGKTELIRRAHRQGHRPAAGGARARHLDRARLRAARAAGRTPAVGGRRARARALRPDDGGRAPRASTCSCSAWRPTTA